MFIAKQYFKSLSVPAGSYILLAVLILYSRSYKVGSFFFEAVSIDLIISAPVFYVIAARKFKTRLLLVFPLIALGFTLSSLLLPKETMTMQWIGKFILPSLELVTIGSVSFYAYQFYLEAKRIKDTDPLTIIRKSCAHLFGHNVISAALATEFAVVYYAFLARRKTFNENSFSSYRENGTLTLYGFFIFIILAETFIFHLLFLKWNVWIAWIILASSLYLALQIFAHARALVLRRTEVADDLRIRYGLAGDVTVRYDQIENIFVTSETPAQFEQPIAIGLLKAFERHSVIIQLKEEVEMASFYNRKKRGRALLLPVDDKTLFAQMVVKKILK